MRDAPASHDDGIDLLRDLSDRVGKLPVQKQERGDRTDRHAEHVVQREPRTDEGGQHIGNVSDIHNDRHKDIGEFIGLRTRFAKLFVHLFKVLDRLLLMREDLDDLASFHHLFDKTVNFAKRHLLLTEIPA